MRNDTATAIYPTLRWACGLDCSREYPETATAIYKVMYLYVPTQHHSRHADLIAAESTYTETFSGFRLERHDDTKYNQI